MNLNLRHIIPANLDRRRAILIGLVFVALVAISIWYFGIRPSQNAAPLTASGTITITRVQIASELGGRVVAVNVDEGDSVLAGDELVQLDATVLQAQRAQAQASYDLLVSGGSPEQRSARGIHNQRPDYTLRLAGWGLPHHHLVQRKTTALAKTNHLAIESRHIESSMRC